MLRLILAISLLTTTGLALAGAPAFFAQLSATSVDAGSASMLDSLFPHGNILVFVAVFVLFLFGMVFGSCAKDGEYKSGFIPALTLLGLIMSFGLYHFIGGFTFQ